MNIMISACLLGVNCRYNGESNKIDKLIALMSRVNLIPICPEQLGGLPTPRFPSEIFTKDDEQKVLDRQGIDVTDQFAKGAEECLRIARLYDCKYAILKERSPSCGSKQIYDGSFQGKLKYGEGMTAALLKKHGIEVYSEENYIELLKIL